MTIGQPIERGLPVAGIPGGPLLGDLDEPQRHRLTNCGGDGVSIDSVFDEVVVSAGELSVFHGLAPMLVKLDLEPIQDPTRR